MRILYIADGRSPIALNWMRYFVEKGYETHLISTFECEPGLDFASLHTVSVAFSGARGGSRSRRTGIGVGARTRLRQWLGPLTLPAAARRVRDHIEVINPDLVHAMRIPFEGMLAASASAKKPYLLSVWGNDFTLHARSSPWMHRLTRNALMQASGLHVDCHRDLRLAKSLGLGPGIPSIVLPGGGGVRPDLFFPTDTRSVEELSPVLLGIPKDVPLVVNPRGIRAYIRNDTFFKSIPKILRALPEALFLCPNMAGETYAQAFVESLQVGESVRLLPKLSSAEMGQLFRMAQVAISLSEHDGTPNTLLEAMACGCFPIAGDLESIREWIAQGKNGVLLEPDDPESLAQAVIEAFSDKELRMQTAQKNAQLIKERASYPWIMAEAEAFYSRLSSLSQ